MKVLYDHQAFTFQYFGGVSKCFCELISHLPPEVNKQISIVESNNFHLIESNICPNIKPVSFDIHSFISKYNFKGKGKLYTLANSLFPNIPTTENINKRKSISLLKEGNFNIFHPTFFDDYFLKYLNGKPFILTIHDMMPELFPQFFKKNDSQIILKKKLVQKASAIIAVSEQTKKDIVNILNVPKNRIEVIYHGGPQKEIIYEKSPYNFPYFLYVGQRWGYKNFQQTLIDFAKFNKTNKNIKLVCTGPKFNEHEITLTSKLNIKEHIIHIFPSESQLKVLYANALAFIYPSLYEGFGMPILESYAYGCPVILNKQSCFPEIANDAAIYFNSNQNQSNLAEVLESFCNITNEDRIKLIDKGYKRLTDFSWKESAQKLHNIYKSI